jgi:hypothetical protein
MTTLIQDSRHGLHMFRCDRIGAGPVKEDVWLRWNAFEKF